MAFFSENREKRATVTSASPVDTRTAERTFAPNRFDDSKSAASPAYYNEERLNSAIGYIAPADKLAGRARQIIAERDSKLEEARKRRAQARQSAA